MTDSRPVFLAIDVGTGSVRAGLVEADGTIAAIAAAEHEPDVPAPGRSEQDPETWWAGARRTVRAVIEQAPDAARRLAGAAVCGQMHGPVGLDADGAVVTPRVQLWNDKRGAAIAETINARGDAAELAARAGNPASPAWMGVKIAWLRDNEPERHAAARVFLTPKDFLNRRLTGVAATDVSEASGSWAMAAAGGGWDDDLIAALGIDASVLAPIHDSAGPIGAVTAEAAEATGLPAGLPVVAGAGDFPAAVLGTGVSATGEGFDVGGTSNIVGALADAPVTGAGLANLRAAGPGWITFGILDSGGDAMRWARRILDTPEADWAAIEEAAAGIPPGAEGLVFLPWLTGERGAGGAAMRGQFFGAATRHGKAHFYRAVMEGVALASRGDLAAMRRRGTRVDRLTAIGGGAKGALWPRIKADVYGLPLVVPEAAEGGLIGCTALAGLGVGAYADSAEAVARLVRLDRTVEPDPARARFYAELAQLFDEIHESTRRHCARLASIGT
ncbi:MAG: FGGY family carbohydrate kinase [Azospirillaceae bacterium]